MSIRIARPRGGSLRHAVEQAEIDRDQAKAPALCGFKPSSPTTAKMQYQPWLAGLTGRSAEWRHRLRSITWPATSARAPGCTGCDVSTLTKAERHELQRAIGTMALVGLEQSEIAERLEAIGLRRTLGLRSWISTIVDRVREAVRP